MRELQLPIVQRLKLLRQRLYAALGYDGNVVVELEEAPDGLYARVAENRIAIPHPLLWKMYRKGWERRLAQLGREYGVGRHFTLGPDSLVLDVGANAGEFAHICARAGAAAHCFEADPSVFACLVKNTAGLKGVTLHPTAIWKEDGEIEFGLAPERSDSSVFAASSTRVRAPAMRIETFVRTHGIDRIDLVKCDAEGAEPEMLEGVGAAFEIIRGFAIDTGPERNGARTNEACGKILRANGFDVFDERVDWRDMTFAINRRGR